MKLFIFFKQIFKKSNELLAQKLFIKSIFYYLLVFYKHAHKNKTLLFEERSILKIYLNFATFLFQEKVFSIYILQVLLDNLQLKVLI